MIFIYLIITACALFGIKYCADGTDYTGKEQGAAVKGLFVLLVFASHAWSYISSLVPGGALTSGFQFICSNLGQMIVVPFLFFSGYGIRFSVEKKGASYVQSMPAKRILKLYIHVFIILLAFLIMQLALGQKYSLGHILSSFVFWNSFGNSNWYLFAIFILYISSYICFSLFKNRQLAVFANICCALAYIFVLSRFKECYWSDTVLAYCFGMVFYDIKDKFKALVNSGFVVWLASLAVSFAIYAVCYKLQCTFPYNSIKYTLMGNIRAIVFMLFIMTALIRFRLGNHALSWLGDHIFEVYLLQRLPMIFLCHMGLPEKSLVLWYVLCATATFILAALCKKLTDKLDKSLF